MATPQTAALAAPLLNGLRSVEIGVPDAAPLMPGCHYFGLADA